MLTTFTQSIVLCKWMEYITTWVKFVELNVYKWGTNKLYILDPLTFWPSSRLFYGHKTVILNALMKFLFCFHVLGNMCCEISKLKFIAFVMESKKPMQYEFKNSKVWHQMSLSASFNTQNLNMLIFLTIQFFMKIDLCLRRYQFHVLNEVFENV